MKFVTYCVIDVGPMWHSCLLLSEWDPVVKKIEVTSSWGLYGLPTTGSDGLIVNLFKFFTRLHVDLQGNHGFFGPEKTHHLDRGAGLHGHSFELSHEQFHQLQSQCEAMFAAQNQAIEEVVIEERLTPKPAGTIKHYPWEHHSRIIFAREQNKALAEGRLSRLTGYNLNISPGLYGLSFEGSHTCKTQAIRLLTGVLTPEQIEQLIAWEQHPTIPRLCGYLESVHLHSQGPLSVHQKASGQRVYFRDGRHPDVKLYWTIPPQSLETSNPETLEKLIINADECKQVKNIVQALQATEWLLLNAASPVCCQELVAKIVAHYEVFSILDNDSTVSSLSDFSGFLLATLSFAAEKKQRLRCNIEKAQQLADALYQATLEKSFSYSFFGEDSSRSAHLVQSVMAGLSEKDKYALCQIFARDYGSDVLSDLVSECDMD